MSTYFDLSIGKLEEFEGSIPWMYLDTVGNVTVAVGLMLPNAAAAEKLGFLVGDRAATKDEIAAEYARVYAEPMGRAALFYRRKGGLELGKAEIDSLLRAVLTGFEEQLRAALAGYDDFPDGVKMALLDMAYNLGPAGLLKGYPKLIRLVAAQDWTAAAAGCYRHGPGATRNEWTRQMFLGNVVGELKAGAESLWKRVGFGLIGLGAAAVEKMRGRKSSE